MIVVYRAAQLLDDFPHVLIIILTIQKINRMEPTEAEDLYDATFIEHPVILDKYKAAAVITNGK